MGSERSRLSGAGGVALMERVGQVTKNASALIVAKIVTSVLGFLLTIVINKQLGPVYAGVYAYAYTLYAMFQVIPDFGLGNISIRDVSQDHAKVRRYFPTVVKLRLLLALAALALITITNVVSTVLLHSQVLAGPKFWVVLTISFALLIEQPFSNSLAENFIGLERLTTVAIVYLIMGIVRVGVSFYIIGAVGKNPTQAEALRALVLLMITYIFTNIYSVAHFYAAYRRVLRHIDYPQATARDKVLAEAVIARAPGTGSVGNALIADYSFSGIASPLAGVPMFTQEDFVEPEEMPLEWQSHITRTAGLGNVRTNGQRQAPGKPQGVPRPAAPPADVQPRPQWPSSVSAPGTQAWDPELAATDQPAPAKATYSVAGPDQTYLKKGQSRSAVDSEMSSGKGLRRYLMSNAWPLAVVGAGVAIYAGLDIPILTWMRGSTAAGYYNAGAMYAKAFAFLTLAVNMAVLPAVSIVAGKHPEKLGELWERLMRYALVVMVPMAVIVPLLARPILVFQRHGFVAAWPVVWMTMVAINFTMMTAISFPFFVAINKQKKITTVILISLVAKAALNVALIPLLGFNGSAVAMLVSEFIVFIALYTLLSRELGHNVRFFRFALVPIGTLAGLYAITFFLEKVLVGDRVFAKHAFLSSLEYALIIAVVVICIYAVVTFASGVLSRARLGELNDLLKVEGEP